MKTDFSIKVQLGIKRAMDILFALLMLFFTFPIMLIVGVWVKLDSPGPAFYRHRRIGKDGRPFNLYKFRTMVTGGDDTTYMNYLRELIESAKANPHDSKPYVKMQDDVRVTRIGRGLRTYYLDELPQMLNILKGELSLVGPRPHVQFEVDNYTPEQSRRLSVKPGATGLWQVAGKADCSFAELLAYDLEYIDNWSLGLDLKIVAMTFHIMSHGGEKFWTRTSKRIPGRKLFGNHRHPTPATVDAPENIAEGGDKRPARSVWSAIRRLIPSREDRSLKEISSIEE